MTVKDHLIEQHFLQHEARLKHVDELLEKAKYTSAVDDAEANPELQELLKQREDMAEQIKALRDRPHDDWEEELIEGSGPMGIWDALAQQIEHFLEKHGK